MQPNPIRIIDLAIQGAIAQLERYQEQILRKERFGSDAIGLTFVYKPGDKEKNEYLSRNLVEKYNDLLKFASDLQAARDKYYASTFDSDFKDFQDAMKEAFKK